MGTTTDDCAAPDLDERPILVVGTMRSGTTLLNRILDAHPDVAMLYDQLDFWRYEHRRFDPLDDERLERLLQGISARRRRRGTPDENHDTAFGAVRARQPRTYASLYATLIRSLKKGDKSRWGEKYAGRGLEVPRFAEAFPKGQVVVIVRDLRDVYLSERRRLQRDSPEGEARGDHLLNVFNWRALVRLTDAYEKAFGTQRVMRLAYEELVRNPEGTVGALCRFLDLTPAATMLDAGHFTDDEGAAWDANSSFELGVRTISSRLSGRWEHDLSDDEIAFLESFAPRELEACGYLLSGRGSTTLATAERVDQTMRIAASYVQAGAYRPFVSAPTYAALGPTSGRVVAIWGTSPRSWSVSAGVADLGGTVSGFVAPIAAPALWMGKLVVPADQPTQLPGAGVDVLAEPDLEPARELTRGAGIHVTPQVINSWSADLERRCADQCVIEASRLLGAGSTLIPDKLDEWRDGLPVGWVLAGASARVATGERGIGAHLEVADGVGSILRRHDFGQTGGEVVAGAWARCTLAEAARVQISDANGDLASLAHPGDGMWHFLAVVGPFEGPVDVYLQVVRPGSATFGDVLTAPIAPAAWRHTGDDGELP